MSDNGNTTLQFALDQSDWGNVQPVGREFGSPDYERLEELDTLACGVLGLKRFREWLDTPSPALDGKTPEEISASPGGTEQIRKLLSNIKEDRSEQPRYP
jgi:hypothetical protein